ncbi:PREDICTED: receptor-type tyrosine-protein phosphatase alpha-like [Branchiostoma belcheri]|uniref:protein-tyrosine-phosphatase n=1 Tax=Branchiostoma belcheri TaxID=7741 RepID=A0A6P4YV51_BRABE|nr:PREDICTED: receptor-type tyrosine-protein phosphatase alpha-like [Branchiostoma belcheri]
MGWKEGVIPLFCVAWLGLINGVVGTTPPQDCADLFAAGTRQSGTYTVGEPSPYRVYCDMSFLGGGWTVLQRRQDGSVDFAKNWADYQQGFGDLTGEFWLGLDNIHTLTTVKSNNILQIELEDFDGGRRYARYGMFSVGDESGNYVVSISGYSGDAGNSLTNTGNRGRSNINGRMFSTIDRDNDGNTGTDCASVFSNGGWWYPLGCGQSFLNGRYNCHQSSVNCGNSQGVVWSSWGGASYFLKKTTIMIRPADFTGSNVPDDCADLYEAGIIESGVNAVSDPRAFVYCDMMKSGGGWTVFQRRQDGSVDFAKNWADYRQGFGDLTGEHWLGLNKQNQITVQKTYSLRVDLEDWESQFRYATYSNFGVGSSSTDYQVSISGYSGDAGDSLTSGGSRFNINGIRFTTSDDNNGPNSNNCASSFGGGGWWFPDSCGYALLNGRYNDSGSAQGVNWQKWRGYGYSLKMSSLKVRPASFSVPSQPLNVEVNNVGNCACLSGRITDKASVTVSWGQPASPNGQIVGYHLSYSTDGQSETLQTFTTNDVTQQINNLQLQSKYTLTVTAYNSLFNGTGSEVATMTTNEGSPPPPLMIPEVPQDEITSSSFKMDIQRASSENGPICCYQIIVVPMTSEETLDTLRSIGLRENTVLTSETTDIAAGRRDLPYVADAFSSEEFSSSITVGNEQRCENDCCNIGPTGHPDGNVYNKALRPNTMYTVTVRAFSVCSNGRRKRQAASAGSDTFTSSEFIEPQQTESGGGGPEPVTSVAGPVVGGIVGVVAVAAIVAGVIIGRRKCPLLRKRDSMGGSSSSSGVRGIDNLAQLENLAPDEDPDHAKPPVAPRKPEPKRHGAAAAKATAASASVRDYKQPVPVECLEHEFNRRHANDDQLFTEEYKALPDNLGMAHAKAYLKKANGEKNRFKNVIAYDNNRVVLTPVEGDPDSDYIHASYIDGYKEERKFIAAQGPKPNTVHDFWRMMWETGSTVIVMVTNLEEKGKIKCTKYWPDSGDEVYGQISVTLAETIPMVYYVSRVFLVSKGEEKKRKITQFQFLGWPDFGAPRNPAELLKFHQKVMTSITSRERPIVVHCSAGVGRTGTFITMDTMLEMMAEEGKVDVFGFVSKTRQSRSQMVQAEAQYIFIYRALLEQYLYGDTEVEVASIHRHLQNLKSEDEDSHKTGLEMEFEKLTSIPIDKANMRNGNLPENISKNRLLQVLPYDTSRVFLLHKTGVTGSDYINASFIDGYREKDAYIATQGPLDRTVEDFWRMVWEWNSCSIVMLTELQEKQRSTCARYWPTEGSKTYGDLTVRLDDTGEFGDFTRRTFSLEDGKGEKSRTIHQFHFHAWPQYGAPDNAAGIIDLIGQVQKQQQLSGNGPITVHCSSGAGRTGTFCAISTVLEQVKTEGTCDVFQTVKALRQQRPHMVQTIDQYQFCYQAIVEYLDSFDHYSNFS